jgi:hypothetical protein
MSTTLIISLSGLTGLTDADTNLLLKGVGRVGKTVQVSSVKLSSGGLPLSCLEVAVSSDGPIQLSSGASVWTNRKNVF